MQNHKIFIVDHTNDLLTYRSVMQLAIARPLVDKKPLKAQIDGDIALANVTQNYKPEITHFNNVMKNIKFRIEESEGQFVAIAVEYAIVTQAKTLLKLVRNIDEAVHLHLNMDKNEQYNLQLDLDPDVLSLVKKSGKV